MSNGNFLESKNIQKSHIAISVIPTKCFAWRVHNTSVANKLTAGQDAGKRSASVSEDRFAFSDFAFNGLVFNPVGVIGVGAGGFGLAWLADRSTIVRALLSSLTNCELRA
jgi:hypothetical protein